ncbi:MAG: AraC family transcriptional regulator [Lewinellaceae bacterium]|nr:AraC family transcriptional regulator [Saprospiraceae bacterium]MCB9336779.1 AraC family transcriptional regulator [Lewinellaceae bacterium]
MKPVLEQITLGKEKSILAFSYSKKDFDAPWHFHPQHELTYIGAGTGTKFIGDFVGSFEPGELVLLRSNLPHCWKNQVRENGKSESTVVQWNKGIYAQAPELAGMFEMLKTASRGIIFKEEDAKPLLPAMLQLPMLAGPELYVELLGLLVRLSGCRHRTLSEASFEDDLPSEYGSRMGNIHDFVEANYPRKIYLRELADLVNMSEQSFSRFFSKMMGRPFFTFLNEYRINMASRMLIDTDWPVAQIGFSCGFESMPFFHKQFAKFKGESPSRYRRRYGGK